MCFLLFVIFYQELAGRVHVRSSFVAAARVTILEPSKGSWTGRCCSIFRTANPWLVRNLSCDILSCLSYWNNNGFTG